MTLQERFWKKVKKTDTCWLWTGTKHKEGYGRFLEVAKGHCISTFAHRASWEIHFGQIPEGLEVCHSCDVRNCVNPLHLFLGTQKDNIQDMISKGRKNQAKGERIAGAKLTSNQVIEIKKRFIPNRVTTTDLAREYGVSRFTVRSIVYGQNWKHI